jgi:glycogen operon protein
MDWSLCEKKADLGEFTRRAVALRKAHPVFRRRRFFGGKPIRTGEQVRDIAWLTPAGEEMTPEDWGAAFGKSIAVFLNGEAIPEPNARGELVTDDSFLLCFNAFDKVLDFVIPADWYAEQWTAALDTAHPTGDTSLVVVAGDKITLQARSLVVLRKTA